ncbi:MAG: T9SS type A sorting domain-containing protein, partial [Sphingobacteriales bacterium]
FFNAQGLITSSYTLKDAGAGIVDTNYARAFVYNSSGTRIESDTTYFGLAGPVHFVGASTYHYGTNNRLDSATFWDLDNTTLVPGSRLKFTYNSNGKISTLKSYDLVSGSPVLSYADSFGYTAGADYFTYYQEDYYNEDGTYSDGYQEIKYVGANNLPDSIEVSTRETAIGAFNLFGTIHTTFNNYDNPERFHVTIEGDTVARIAFYYELWDDGLSIKPVAQNSNFSVYPNPFTNAINIDWKGQQTNAATVRLLNVIGQEVYSSKLNLNSGKNTLQLPALSSGQYVMLIQDASGKAWSTKVVKK